MTVTRERVSDDAEAEMRRIERDLMVITEKAVSNHITMIFAKLGLLPDLDGNRRVLAVLAFLDAA